MKIEIKGKVTFEFTSDEYILCESDNKDMGDYSLNYLINRSEKGKILDIGIPAIYLTKEKAEALLRSGFSKTY